METLVTKAQMTFIVYQAPQNVPPQTHQTVCVEITIKLTLTNSLTKIPKSKDIKVEKKTPRIILVRPYYSSHVAYIQSPYKLIKIFFIHKRSSLSQMNKTLYFSAFSFL